MSMIVTPSGQACGAAITHIDLTKDLNDQQVADIRAAWLEHHVLSFPDQAMSDEDLERFTGYFGGFGDDPFIAAIEGHPNIIAVQRLANEQAPLFAENWHTDWSFQKVPPDGTCLYSLTIPPQGGDTLYSNQHLALEKMPANLRARIEGKLAVHTAKAAYAPDGAYGDSDRATDRSMDIRPSAEAEASRLHPLIRQHPETGRDAIYGCVGYILGIDGMNDEEAVALLFELHEWQDQEQFQYRHKWGVGELVMWDNRSVLHKATGGYDGYDRVLHRTTIAGTTF